MMTRPNARSPIVNLVGDAHNAWRAFECGAIPFPASGRRLICGIEESEERIVRIRCGADDIVRQEKLAEALAEEGCRRRDGGCPKSLRLRIGVGVERCLFETGAARPKSRATDLVRISIAHHHVRKAGDAARV